MVIPRAFGDRHKLSTTAQQHFIKAFPRPSSRNGTWIFPRAIIGESEWLDGLWAKRETMKNKPVLLLWGLKDVAFTKELLARWEAAFPSHTTVTFTDVGHFAPEEIGRDAIPPVETFLRG